MMTWTKQPPTEDGYYWHRDSIEQHAVIRYVVSGKVRHGVNTVGTIDDYGGEWWGPLPEPGGDAVEDDA